jgi:hypothetical protein
MYWRLLAVGEDRALPHRLVPEASDVAHSSVAPSRRAVRGARDKTDRQLETHDNCLLSLGTLLTGLAAGSAPAHSVTSSSRSSESDAGASDCDTTGSSASGSSAR